jgi:hypothetical protein
VVCCYLERQGNLLLEQFEFGLLSRHQPRHFLTVAKRGLSTNQKGGHEYGRFGVHNKRTDVASSSLIVILESTVMST